MSRVYNFSAGPVTLPAEVLAAAEADLRELLAVPASYKVLFLQGGATQQFAEIPLNLLDGGSADYLVTGSWSKKAYKEAQRVTAGRGTVRLAGSTEAGGFARFPEKEELDLDPEARYLHLCTNETIHGVEVQDDCAGFQAGVPVVADMSSHILSRRVDVSRYGLIYAGAQKNIGPSGLVLVIVREDLLGRAAKDIPTVMDYAVMAEHGSMLNTPPTYAIYIAGLVFQWLKGLGGLAAMEAINVDKARRLYEYIDASGFYENRVAPAARSRMNIPGPD